jgi:hypothetical protein
LADYVQAEPGGLKATLAIINHVVFGVVAVGI